MEKRKIFEVLKQVLSDASPHFDDAKEFIKEPKEACAQEKILVVEVIFF